MLRTRSLLSRATAAAALAPLMVGAAVLLPGGAAQAGVPAGHPAAARAGAPARQAPVITLLSPDGGPVEGHNTVIINGSGFGSHARVRFGKKPALKILSRSSTRIVVIAPPQRRIRIVRLSVISGRHRSNRLHYTYSTAQVDEYCQPGAPTGALILWASPRHTAVMFDRTTHKKTLAVLTDLNPQDRNWRFGIETGLPAHHVYRVRVWIDHQHKARTVRTFVMGKKCGRTIWRGQVHPPHHHRHHHH